MIHPVLTMWVAKTFLNWKDGELSVDWIFGRQPVEHARNSAVETFLERSGFEWLLMVDNDMVPDQGITDILDEAPAPCVITPLSYRWASGSDLFSLTCGGYDEENRAISLRENIKDGLNEVQWAGTGFLFIHREILLALHPPYFKNEQDSKTRKIVKGEDHDFCFRAIRAGFKIYADSRFSVGHSRTLDMRDLHIAFFNYGLRVASSVKKQVAESGGDIRIYTRIPGGEEGR